MAIGNIFRTVSNFLFSKANREFLVFVFFFVVAGIFWLFMTLNETYEQELRVSVKYTNVPKLAVLTSPETDTIKVVVSDKGFMLASYLFGKGIDNIEVSFGTYANSSGKGSVSASDLIKLVAPHLASSTKIVSIKPDRLNFYYNYGEKKRVPVNYRGNVMPEDLYYISNIQYQPDSVTVYASKKMLDSIDVVYTEMLNYTDFRDTLTVSARLQSADGVKVVPNEVDIRFVTDVLTEGNIADVPVVGINMPKGKVLRTFPAKVSVRFVTGMKTYSMLRATDFLVVADYKEFEKDPSPKCNIYLQRVPEGITRATLDLKQVDYLIEEKN